VSYREFTPGTKVKLSGQYLRNTGQTKGGEGALRLIVRECDCAFCKRGTHVATDQESLYSSPEEIQADPRLRWRHIAKEALTIVGQLDLRNCPR
jgi:hypothetical protein